ncbi:PLDc N-terminal domain-containing protein [Sphingobacterium sp. SG20118]|uniref:PLDc N-terminal domain-containing protein n=1 Tax=Sphingobacterium sp. SG20118 TaxID=3367156 RepID=UPI0037DFC5C8
MSLSFINIGATEMAILFIPPFLVMIYTIYHIINNDMINGNNRIFWIISILLLNFIRCIFYWWYGKGKITNNALTLLRMN